MCLSMRGTDECCCDDGAAEQAAAGEEEGTASAHYVPCPDCEGSGIDGMDGSVYCPLCDGNGTVTPAVAASVSTAYKAWAGPYRAG